MRQLKVIISGGGSGGHIFPALSIAKSLEKKNKNIKFLFVGAKNKMEMEKIPSNGYNIKGLWISGFQRRFTIDNFLFPIKLFISLISSYFIIKDFKPDLVIGTGGFASGPILYVASKCNIPTLIQEQNSYPGITNRILSRYVNKICVAYDKMNRFFKEDKLLFTGNPIRENISNFSSSKETGYDFFNLDNNQCTVLVIGGSLGARTINLAISNSINFFKKNKINLIWQTGISFDNKANKIVSSVNIKTIKNYQFINRMDLAYKVCDIIVSRAGAIAISELCCIGKPVILVPSPNVAEDHQYKNAQSLVNKNAALLVNDSQANDKLVSTIDSLINNKTLQNNLSKNIKELEVHNSSNTIAEIALNLLNE
ncbi:MAG: undecaprenyldiphospho-muramoylpentapeptide beta-N-acetylglucosaminyltransferase [Flavobacteriales bacterium]|jgi:UDP-N-acetylglucosamine--N-acetylmuramyl-(pentapeptide) pyrophosphoryl-undecaprenol N-acetylglucosamine transferase|tara:strand:- start:6969 stop:8072 length:1104 start_codon:yes stop_codon:yes gene_type:complete